MADPEGVLRYLASNRASSRGKKVGLVDVILGNWNKAELQHEKELDLVPNLENGKQVYLDTCSNKCHMPESWGKADGEYPQLAGQHRSVTIKQLADIRAKNRDNPTMFRFALPSEIGGVQNIADVAAYIEQLPMTPDNGKGPGTDLEKGKAIYDRDCALCHMRDGEGDPSRYYPRIQGQHYNYLVRQFEWIRDGKRRTGHPLMVIQIESYGPEEVHAVMDYVSRLTPPKRDLASTDQLPQVPQETSPAQEGDGLL
ncbi:MAG: c-type cytochrome [Magnetococcales bacterium]|nr:c-type cytochrome [Magnetococcales bacterium]